ncbi:hypothetical protein J2S09_003763 [Bacillus fengqiuensis]|nr:hypothetical protein [Bacillus fengqiuensis]
MSRLLVEDRPILILPSLAKEVGLNEAIFLQQLHYWLQESGHEYFGHKWVYNTYEQWQVQFPFWSVSTIRRIIAKLEKDGYIISSRFNRMKSDQTKWYRIHYLKMEIFSGQPVQHEQKNRSDRADDFLKMDKPIPETTTEKTNTEKDDDEGAHPSTFEPVGVNKEIQTNTEPEQQDDASNLEQLFLQRRGRGIHPSAKDLQAIQEVVQSGIPFEEAAKWLNEAFDFYEPKYSGDRIHSFAYVKQYIFHRAYLKQEREQARRHGIEQGRIDFNPSPKPKYRGRTGRKEMVPDWLDKQHQPEQQEPVPVLSQLESHFEEEKAKLMEELAQYKK